MAEQSTITLSGLPVDGDPITATDGQYSAIAQIADEFNKQVPVSKISAEQPWTTYISTLTGWSGTPSQSNRYVKNGRSCTIGINISGPSNDTAATITLPFVAAVTQYFPVFVVTDGGSLQSTPGRIDTNNGSNVANVYKTAATGAWTNTGTKSLIGTITFETTT